LGALVRLVAIQVSVFGSYLPPVFKPTSGGFSPPQTIISLVVHTAVWAKRAPGALVVLVAVQVSVFGSYLPPVFRYTLPEPPHIIISLLVHTAV
jgi:hypothetical protein